MSLAKAWRLDLLAWALEKALFNCFLSSSWGGWLARWISCRRTSIWVLVQLDGTDSPRSWSSWARTAFFLYWVIARRGLQRQCNGAGTAQSWGWSWGGKSWIRIIRTVLPKNPLGARVIRCSQLALDSTPFPKLNMFPVNPKIWSDMILYSVCLANWADLREIFAGSIDIPKEMSLGLFFCRMITFCAIGRFLQQGSERCATINCLFHDVIS